MKLKLKLVFAFTMLLGVSCQQPVVPPKKEVITHYVPEPCETLVLKPVDVPMNDTVYQFATEVLKFQTRVSPIVHKQVLADTTIINVSDTARFSAQRVFNLMPNDIILSDSGAVIHYNEVYPYGNLEMELFYYKEKGYIQVILKLADRQIIQKLK